MCDGVITSVITIQRETNIFSNTVVLYQWSILSPHLFVLAIIDLTKHIQNEVLRYMLSGMIMF